MNGVKAERQWHIPILLSTDGQPKDATPTLHWLSTQETTLALDPSKWFILNTDAAGSAFPVSKNNNFLQVLINSQFSRLLSCPLRRAELCQNPGAARKRPHSIQWTDQEPTIR